MIQTKTALFYEDRGDKFAKIKIEIENFVTDKDGTTFTVKDWAVDENGNRTLHKTKYVKFDNATIDGLDNYMEANNNFEGLSKTEKEWEKLAIGLMVDTTTNLLPSGLTIYRLQATDWEFTPEAIEPIV
jgi:hypothetical protein